MCRGATPQDHRILPRRIILVRHAESEGNIDNFAYTYVPDPQVPLVSQHTKLYSCCFIQCSRCLLGERMPWLAWHTIFISHCLFALRQVDVDKLCCIFPSCTCRASLSTALSSLQSHAIASSWTCLRTQLKVGTRGCSAQEGCSDSAPLQQMPHYPATCFVPCLSAAALHD